MVLKRDDPWHPAPSQRSRISSVDPLRCSLLFSTHAVPKWTFMGCTNGFPCPLASGWTWPMEGTTEDQRTGIERCWGICSVAFSLPGHCRRPLLPCEKHSFCQVVLSGEHLTPGSSDCSFHVPRSQRWQCFPHFLEGVLHCLLLGSPYRCSLLSPPPRSSVKTPSLFHGAQLVQRLHLGQYYRSSRCWRRRWGSTGIPLSAALPPTPNVSKRDWISGATQVKKDGRNDG